MTRIHRAPRASMYVAVLMTATAVFVVGVAGLLAVRVQIGAGGDTRDVTAAQFLAHAAIELALLKLETDPYGYVGPPAPGWQSASALERGSCTWRLIDEGTGNVALRADGVLRLHGKGMVGNASRIISVQLVARDAQAAANLITSGDMESPIVWETLSACDYEYLRDFGGQLPHSGQWFLYVKNRATSQRTALQDITGKLTGSGQAFDMEAWALAEDDDEQARFVFVMQTSSSGGLYVTSVPAQTIVKKTWTHITASHVLTWTGTLQRAFFGLATMSSTQEIAIDDLVLVPQGSTGVEIRVVPGTWLQDVE